MRGLHQHAVTSVTDALNPDQQQRAAVLEHEAKRKFDAASKRTLRADGGGRGGRGRPLED